MTTTATPSPSPAQTQAQAPFESISAPSPASAGGPPAIVADDVRKFYTVGDTQLEVLHGVSLGVAPGELVAVMGPSGSGKSTLLYCLAGLERPTAGAAEILGRNTTVMSRAELARMRRREVGFVFQQYNLVPTLTARENVALPLRLDGKRPNRATILATLASVGIEKLADKRPGTLSGGEQQRVALARVLAQDPRVVFADEPTGALDSASGILVLDELARIAHSPGRCVLMVTHDPAVAARCDRVVFLRDGRLVAQVSAPTTEAVSAVMLRLSQGA